MRGQRFESSGSVRSKSGSVGSWIESSGSVKSKVGVLFAA